MNKEVYLYLLKTFGRLPGVWVGASGRLANVILTRIVSTALIAQVANSLTSGNTDKAQHYALLYLGLYVLGICIGISTDLVAINSQNKGYNDLRKIFYKRLLGKDMAFYRNNQTGYLTSAFRQHLDGLMILGRIMRTQAVQTLATTLIPVIVLWVASWKLGVLALAIVIIQFGYIYWASAKSNKYRELSHEVYRKLSGEVSDEITNIVAFKSSGQAEKGYKKVLALGEQETNAFWLRHKVNRMLDVPRDLITAISVSLGIIIAIHASQGSETIGVTVMAVLFFYQIVQTMSDVPNLLMQLDDLVTQVYPTLAYLKTDHYHTINDPEKPAQIGKVKGAIELRDVSFAYRSHNNKHAPITVFKDLNIAIANGEQVGIVGLSGAGKSTLVSLLLRFDDVTGGSVRLDGTDIRNMRQTDLHNNIAYVPQEPLLFHRTIRENIAYYSDADDAAIVKAAKAAHAHEFITELPEGYDTVVGERGLKLSGGQKQRVVIARAILKNAPVMILDEATSALDSESEQIIQAAMPKILGKRTAVVIAHRLSTVANLDRIIVLEKGKVIEQGTHTELIKQQGRYASLWKKQAK